MKFNPQIEPATIEVQWHGETCTVVATYYARVDALRRMVDGELRILKPDPPEEIPLPPRPKPARRRSAKSTLVGRRRAKPRETRK